MDIIKSYDDYKLLLMRIIRKGYSDVFRKMIVDKTYDKYKLILLEDTSSKEKILNYVFKTKNEEFSLSVLDGLDMLDDIPEYNDISDLVYTSENRLINKKRDIYYIFNRCNFDEFWSMEDLYSLCDNDKVLGRIMDDLEVMLKRRINDEEKGYIIESSMRYRDYIDTVINEIKMYDECPDSEGDCYGLLCEYLGRKPSKWEVKLLWKNVM